MDSCACGCGREVTPSTESYTRDGWLDTCAQADVWANTPSGREALRTQHREPA